MINQKKFITLIQKNILNHTNDEKINLTIDSEKEYQKAAVMILLTREDGEILFIKRSTELNLHKGEIGFPGGKVEIEDKSLLHTALRELYEEIKLHKSQVEIIGKLPTIITSTGFKVTPFIGLISKYAFHFSDSDEVEAIINVPFDFFLQDNNHKEVYYGKKSVHFFFYKKHVIWGATASIIRNLISN